METRSDRQLVKHLKLFALLLLFAPPVLAQGIGNATVRHFAGAPTGGCSANQFGINDASGALYDCKAGAWNAIGTGTLSGSLTATRIPYASGASTLIDNANFKFLTTASQLEVGPQAAFGGNGQYYIDISTSSITNLNTTTANMTSNGEGNALSGIFQTNDANVSPAGVVGVGRATSSAAQGAVGVIGIGELGATVIGGGGTGVNATASNLGGTGSSIIGVNTGAENSGTTADGIGIRASVSNFAGVLTAAYGVKVNSLVVAGGSATTNYGLFIDNQTAGGTNYAIKTGTGLVSLGDAVSGTSFTGASYLTTTNCADSAGAAACGSAAAGGVVIDAAATSVVVSTTAVTANSEILIQDDSSLSTRLSVTCNTQALTVLGVPTVTARTAGASFTITIAVGPTTNPLCLNYSIVN